MAIKKLYFQIEKMHCRACASGVDLLLNSTGGVKRAVTNYERKESEVEFDEEKIKPADIAKLIEELGYKAASWN